MTRQRILAHFEAISNAVGMKPNRSTLIFLATLAVAAGLVFWVIWRTDHRSAARVQPTGWQHADEPPSGETPMDPRLLPPDVWTEAATPVASAIGPATPADAAFGDDVLAVSDGIVLFAGGLDGARAVILGHRGADGVRFESIYTPLAEVACNPGELVGRGMVVGRLGGQPLGPLFRVAPGGIGRVVAGKSALAEVLEAPDTDAWMSLEIGNAEKMIEFIEEPPAEASPPGN